MEQKTIDNPLIKKWLKIKKSSTTRAAYRKRIKYVLEHFKMSAGELLELSPKEARELCLVYQSENRHLSNNSILGRMTAVSSFMDYNDKPIIWKRGQKVRPRPDVTSHVFSNGDLSRMFAVGDLRDKAMLALATSLGWEISSFTDLSRETLRQHLERAEETKEQFIYFQVIREKTGQPRLGVLNPCAIEWCTKWMKLSENQELHQNKMRTSDIFNLSEIAIYKRIKVLAKKAGLKTTGSIKFHNIRKWVMSGLSRSGFNEWQTKYVLGKAIPMSDGTYLQSLEEEVRERYPSAYENYLNLNPQVNLRVVSGLSKDLEEKTEEIGELRNQLDRLDKENVKLKNRVNEFSLGSDQVEELLRRIEKLEKRAQ